MGQQFCTACGSKLTPGTKFCENCGAPVEPAPPGAAVSSPVIPAQIPPADPAPGSKRISPLVIVAGIMIVLVIIAAAAALVILPNVLGGSLPSLPGQATTVPTTIPTPVPTTIPVTVTTVPTPVPDPFPDAYHIRELFSYNEGKYASRATVYRYWVNETYHWHNDLDNKYYTEPGRPDPASKYLLVFVNIENLGSDGYPYPKSNMIVIHNGGQVYHVDTAHFLPDKSGGRDETPVEIQEIELFSDYYNLEHVEDYGYSHGTTQDFVYPGQGNAVDGYLIYKVPASLKPEESYVEIVFDGQDHAVWKLG